MYYKVIVTLTKEEGALIAIATPKHPYKVKITGFDLVKFYLKFRKQLNKVLISTYE
jgi:hypothetical protein